MKRIASVLLLIAALSITAPAHSYTRDWENTNPIDHSLNSTWPAEIREVRVDIEDRLDDIMDSFTSGDTVTRFNRVPFYNQGSDETGVADSVVCYSKDVSSEAELHCAKEDNDVVQITSAGGLNAGALTGTMSTALQDQIYPVGSIYISTVSTNPGTLLGFGTWAAWGEGKVIVGLDSGDTDFDTSEETGGSKTVTLTTAEMPAHSHGISTDTNPSSGASGAAGEGSQDDQTRSTDSAGSGDPFSIIQPYIVAYMWERTS